MIALKPDAETLRWRIALGVLPVTRAVSWADAIIAADRAGDAPSAYELALGARSSVAEAVDLLSAVPGGCAPNVVGRRLASILRDGLASGRLDVELVARSMHRMRREGLAPDDAFESMAYVADDGVDLARAGTFGTLQQLADDLGEFLGRYSEAPLDILPGPA